MIEWTLQYVFRSLWQIPAVLFVTWLLARCDGTSSPRIQFRIWISGLCAALVIPVFSQLGASLYKALQPAPPLGGRLPNASFGSPVVAPASHPALWLSHNTAYVIVMAYFITVTIGVVRILRNIIAARKLLKQTSELSISPRMTNLLEECCEKASWPRFEARACPTIHSPATIGIRTRYLLLPENFSDYTDDEMRAVLYHEIAHIYRNDYFSNLVCELFSLPSSWHPAINFMKRRISFSRELICDDFAARHFGSGKDYARSLLSVASHAGQRRSYYRLAVNLISNQPLEDRIMKLTHTTHNPLGRINLSARFGCAVLGLTVFGGALFFAPLPTIHGQSDKQAKSSYANPSAGKGKLVILEELPPQERERIERELGISVPELLAAADTINRSSLSAKVDAVENGNVLRRLDDPATQDSIDVAIRAVDSDEVSVALKQVDKLDDPSVWKAMENLPQTLAVIDQAL